MQLNIRDLSKLLHVSERTVYRWIKEQGIPHYKIQDQYRFNRLEILDWATARHIHVSYNIIRDDDENESALVSLSEIIKKGGIHYCVEGKDKPALLKSVIDLLDLPDSVNKKYLLDAMLVREELGSTGLGDGIALPHARSPVVTHLPGVIVSICFLKHPVDYGALDGKPVNCLFTIISPTVRSHLQILSSIAFVLRDVDVKDAIVKQKPKGIIIQEIERAEKLLLSK